MLLQMFSEKKTRELQLQSQHYDQQVPFSQSLMEEMLFNCSVLHQIACPDECVTHVLEFETLMALICGPQKTQGINNINYIAKNQSFVLCTPMLW